MYHQWKQCLSYYHHEIWGKRLTVMDMVLGKIFKEEKTNALSIGGGQNLNRKKVLGKGFSNGIESGTT